ncbi:MAG: hypothetical protein NWR21_01855, partial [Verrucomicrobiales bacterium]|nr:hypothetical protein [Verrucomicrobiales bacterium]
MGKLIGVHRINLHAFPPNRYASAAGDYADVELYSIKCNRGFSALSLVFRARPKISESKYEVITFIGKR